jgi:hypothetical protein
MEGYFYALMTVITTYTKMNTKKFPVREGV